MTKALLFYHHDDVPYGCFSNFSRHPVKIYGRTWMTSEHPFQVMKFHPHRPDLVDAVHAAESPGKAAKMARDRSLPLRADWDQAPSDEATGIVVEAPRTEDFVNRGSAAAEPLFSRMKDIVMYEVVLAKFRQNDDAKKILLGTGDDILIEDAEFDPYWGWGASKVGQNKLGRILMSVRSIIRL